ncbi:hypothetical protein AABB24_026187 [Solanum stoloniferum]|uniref:Uncharacterized protein n=1 Tax=Solanum stoloniferum TaxID=62892 RepID=A0ABD2SDV9_9SOLN
MTIHQQVAHGWSMRYEIHFFMIQTVGRIVVALEEGLELMANHVTTSYLKIISSYVMQDDQFFPMLTVPVTFMFAAEVRLPASVSRAERKTTALSWSIKYSITDLDPSSII